MFIDDVLASLRLDMDVRLHRFKKKDLIALLNGLVMSKSKWDLVSMVCDEEYFSLEELMEACEDLDKRLLFSLLREPRDKKSLRKPLSRWLRDRGYTVRYNVHPPIKGRWRSIDMVGFSEGGLLTEPSIAILEIQTKVRKRDVESAFKRADAFKICSNHSYVTFTPHVYLKHKDHIVKQTERFDSIGVLVSDKREVTFELEASETEYKEDKWKKIASYFK